MAKKRRKKTSLKYYVGNTCIYTILYLNKLKEREIKKIKMNKIKIEIRDRKWRNKFESARILFACYYY